MSAFKHRQRQMRISPSESRETRTQFGALCWRRQKEGVRVLLVTSRRTRRWILPKGWPIDGRSGAETAATEAWEEAGVLGQVSEVCLGIYSYIKEREDDDDVPCVVAVFPIEVTGLRDDFPEARERKRRWVRPKKAAQLVTEPELAAILRGFDPQALAPPSIDP